MKYSVFLFAFLILTHLRLYSQEEVTNSEHSIRTGIGYGHNEGMKEIGNGSLYSIGYQKSFGKKQRIRLNPNLVMGGFTSDGISNTREQFYRITSLDLSLNYDFIKYESFAAVISPGFFLNYSRGFLGPGGRTPITNYDPSEYLSSLYTGCKISLGFSITSEYRKLTYDINLLNIHFNSSNNYFFFIYFIYGINIKLGK